jgi:hypothetical protein
LPSPTSATSVGAFCPIDSAAMSSWTMRTFLLKRGGRPKCMIQFRRAPSRKITSAFCSAWLRAAPTDSGCVSGMTPLPIGEARNGSLVRSMKARTSSSAREYAMPLPMMTSGRSAVLSTSSARSTSAGAACVRGGSGQRAGSSTRDSSTFPVMMSSGRSR